VPRIVNAKGDAKRVAVQGHASASASASNFAIADQGQVPNNEDDDEIHRDRSQKNIHVTSIGPHNRYDMNSVELGVIA